MAWPGISRDDHHPMIMFRDFDRELFIDHFHVPWPPRRKYFFDHFQSGGRACVAKEFVLEVSAPADMHRANIFQVETPKKMRS